MGREQVPGNPLFVSARHRRGWYTQEEFAAAFERHAARLGRRGLSVSVRQVRRWESAVPPWPGAEYRRVLTSMFEVPIERLGFRPPGPPSPGPGDALVWPAHGWDRSAVERLARRIDDDAPVTTEDARTLAHAWLISDPPRIPRQRTGRRVGDGLVQDLRRRTDRLRRMDDFLGGADMVGPVVAELRAVLHVLREASYPEATGRALLTLTGELAQLGGWVASDAGYHEAARRLYLCGVSAAHAAGDRALAAHLLSSLAYQSAAVGDPHEAVVLARSALAGARRAAAPRVLALLHDRVAWAHARAGQAESADRALAGAEEAMDACAPGRDVEPDWIYWVDRDELTIMAGRVHTECRRPLRAVPLLSGTIARYDPSRVRETALYRSWLAAALLDANEVEAAAEETARVVSLSAGIASARTERRVSGLLERLRPHRALPVVRRLLDIAAARAAAGD